MHKGDHKMNRLRRLWEWLLIGWSRQAASELLIAAICTGDDEAKKIALEKLDELDKK